MAGSLSHLAISYRTAAFRSPTTLTSRADLLPPDHALSGTAHGRRGSARDGPMPARGWAHLHHVQVYVGLKQPYGCVHGVHVQGQLPDGATIGAVLHRLRCVRCGSRPDQVLLDNQASDWQRRVIHLCRRLCHRATGEGAPASHANDPVETP